MDYWFFMEGIIVFVPCNRGQFVGHPMEWFTCWRSPLSTSFCATEIDGYSWAGAGCGVRLGLSDCESLISCQLSKAHDAYLWIRKQINKFRVPL